MALKFKETIKHGRETILPGVAVAFEDTNAEPYFSALGWAETTSDAPVHTYSAEAVAIDPDAVFADGPDKGRKILGG